MGVKLKQYMFFCIPPLLAEKGVKNWTKKEAASYLEWVLNEIDERIAILLTFFDLNDDDFDSVDLNFLGEKIVKVLRTDLFSEADDLTDHGYALAADIGLLIAKKLLRNFSCIRWQIEKGPKTGYSYNRPVLEGFGKIRLDPIGGMIGELKGVLIGARDDKFLINLYDFWRTKALESTQQ